jgi:aarF domain-containing kinase
MPDGTLGLIDYGQTKSISEEERLRIAQVVAALGEVSNEQEIAKRMRDLGFKTKFNDDKILAKYAALFFDSDIDAKAMGCATPQLYFAKLTTADPLVHVPDVASKNSVEGRKACGLFIDSLSYLPHCFQYLWLEQASY